MTSSSINNSTFIWLSLNASISLSFKSFVFSGFVNTRMYTEMSASRMFYSSPIFLDKSKKEKIE